MNDQRYYSLKELQEAAYQACEAAVQENRCGRLDGPVNWSGLQCNFAHQWLDQNGGRGYRVFIEEASPEAYALQIFINEWLCQNGFENIEVTTEW